MTIEFKNKVSSFIYNKLQIKKKIKKLTARTLYDCLTLKIVILSSYIQSKHFKIKVRNWNIFFFIVILLIVIAS